jgi:hypothetical protein
MPYLTFLAKLAFAGACAVVAVYIMAHATGAFDLVAGLLEAAR